MEVSDRARERLEDGYALQLWIGNGKLLRGLSRHQRRGASHEHGRDEGDTSAHITCGAGNIDLISYMVKRTEEGASEDFLCGSAELQIRPREFEPLWDSSLEYFPLDHIDISLF